ncbi:alkaline phosphatase-like [Ctenocephalides felis]|uniref:alkaline phosphatase-like n=1 Tax=Ctenocephalides felis TaxID=7515 RepID=UPI000E6E5916|nr:alkaline phosphatase-like [Ctenocephalides felis]
MFLKICIFLVFLSVLCSGREIDRDPEHPVIDYSRAIVPNEEKLGNFWWTKAKEQLKHHVKRKLNKNEAKNIIMFLGDGMSIPTLAAARVVLGNENKELSFEKFPYTGLSKTYCVDGQTADSACSATAYLCGIKANDGTIGVSANVTRKNCETMADTNNHVHSIAKWAQDKGKATGIVTTTRVTHASPAGTFAHTADRDWESDTDVIKKGKADPLKCRDIAHQLIHQEPGKNFKVILGGGRGKFLPNNTYDEEQELGQRSDGRNLIEEWKTEMGKKGKSEYVWNKKQLDAVDADKTDFLLGLFESSHCKYHLDVVDGNLESKEPSLAEMVAKAIDILGKEKKGFFLFVEGGRIDHAHHETKPRKALDETIEMAKAVTTALNKTSEDETLIVVTADHAHTLSISGYPIRGNDIFGLANPKADDDLPLATLNYANGPGYKIHFKNGTRQNFSKVVDNKNKDYQAPGIAPLYIETHGGDDVAVFANGPWAHLFTGTFEQNLIPHMMAYAGNIDRNGGEKIGGFGVIFIVILIEVVLRIFS